MVVLLRTKRMQLYNHADTQTVKRSQRWKGYAIYSLYSIKFGMLDVREKEIAVRKLSGGSAQLRTSEVTLFIPSNSSKRQQLVCKLFLLKSLFYDWKFNRCTKKSNLLRNAFCLSAGTDSLLSLQFKPTIWSPNYPRKHNYICSNQERHFHQFCRVLHFNHQNLMLISPPNYYAIHLEALIENIPLIIKNSRQVMK